MGNPAMCEAFLVISKILEYNQNEFWKGTKKIESDKTKLPERDGTIDRSA